MRVAWLTGQLQIGLRHLRLGAIDPAGKSLDALLCGTHATEILIELLAVGAAESAMQRLRLTKHSVKDGTTLCIPFECGLAVGRRVFDKEPLKQAAG